VELAARVIACRAEDAHGSESIRIATRRDIHVKAREYIDANLESPISIADICHHVDVSISTLERVFRRTAGMTPLAYIRSRRMNRARHLLLTHRREITVAEAALQSGLTHFGRFSRSDRSFFGELLSQTDGAR